MGLLPEAGRPCAGDPAGLRDPDRRETRLHFIVRESYDEIYEFDLRKDLCHVVQSGAIYGAAPGTLDLGEMVMEAERSHIHPEDIRLFREVFAPDSILRRFAAGEREITAEYRRRPAGGAYRWYSMCMKPFLHPEDTAPPGSAVIVMYKDIDRRKRAEEAARRLQTKYFLALRTACGHILDINASTGFCVLSITGDSLLERAPREGEFSRLANWMTHHAIHPADAAAWLEAMSPQNLRERFCGGRCQISADYRFGNAQRGWQWRCDTAVWLAGETADEDSILIFSRDISEQKKAEELELSNRLLRQEIEHRKRNAAHDARYRIIVEQTGVGIFEWILDAKMPPSARENPERIAAMGHFCNTADIVRQFRLESEGDNLLQVLAARGDIHPEDLDSYEAFRLGKNGGLHREVLCRVQADGEYLWHKFTMTTILDGGSIERTVGTVLNVDRETRSSLALELSNMRYRTVLQQTDTIEFEYDAAAGEMYISPVLRERYDTAQPDPDARGELISYLRIHPDDREKAGRIIERSRRERPNRCEMRCRVRDKTGAFVWCRIIIDFFRDNDGRLLRVLGTLHNVDGETRAYEALKNKAERDALTGIWNQETFFLAVSRLLSLEAGRPKMAMIMMDIDKFKVINEIFGMDGGNRALALVGSTLRRILGTDGYYARMYADVFCMTVPYQEDGDLVRLMVRIMGMLSTREFDYMLVPCFGVCRIPPHAAGASQLVEMAGYAHKAVKTAAGRQWAFYDETMRSTVVEKKQIESEMEQALRSRQFQIYLQPKYSLPGRSVEGAEALVRWIHPQKGLIPPNKFIPLFEENGFIIQLDTYVWEEACRLIRRWMDAGKRPLPVSVNVSRMHIHNPALRETLRRLTEKYRIPRGMLELELTESMFPDNMQGLLAMMRDLQESGFVLAMDDFGSGYSSLNMLKDMPLNVLKIDCEFFGETGEEKRGRTVVRHTVAMAHELDMRVVAEGVETESEAAFLSETGCDTAQGFYFARPVPVEEFEALAFA